MRRRYSLVFTVLMIGVCSGLLACQRSGDKDTAPKSNVLKDYIKTPIDKANAVKTQQEERDKRMADALKEQ